MEIETSARLHLSLIDLNGKEGRLDGGLGVALKDPSLKIECKEAGSEDIITFEENVDNYQKKSYIEKINEVSRLMKEYLEINTNYEFTVKEIYPIHQGLGLGTQLALSIADLISQSNSYTFDSFDLANIIQRGGTSGIGVHAYDKGGFIVDGGHKKTLKKDFLPSSATSASPPPLLARYDFPDDWNIILATPLYSNGASGKKEIDIFQDYTPISLEDVQRISYLTLMKVMPSIVEHDLDSFGDGIKKIQSLGFKNIEKKLQTEQIHSILDVMGAYEIPCVGMSSFGSTCFGITDTNPKALLKQLNQMISQGNVILTKGKNHGSVIKY